MINDIFMYDAYGVLDYQFSSNETIFTYVGRYGVVTDDNGLYYMRARYYEPNVVYDSDTGRYIYYWGETGTPNIHYAVKDAKDPREVASSMSDQDRAELAVDDELWEQAYWTIMYLLELEMLKLYGMLSFNFLLTTWGILGTAGAGFVGTLSAGIGIATLEHNIMQLAALQLNNSIFEKSCRYYNMKSKS